MLRKSYAIFGLALVELSCGTGPKVSPCFVNTDSRGCFYAPPGGDDVLLRPFDKTPSGMEKNICFTPEEHQLILEWIKRHGGSAAAKMLAPYEEHTKIVMEKTNVIGSQ